MTFFEGFSCLATIATLFVGVAALEPEKRAWAKKRAAELMGVMFYVFGISTGAAGIIMFGIADSSPTRGQILLLVMHLFNFFMCIALAVHDTLERRREPSRKALVQARASFLTPMESNQKVSPVTEAQPAER